MMQVLYYIMLLVMMSMIFCIIIIVVGVAGVIYYLVAGVDSSAIMDLLELFVGIISLCFGCIFSFMFFDPGGVGVCGFILVKLELLK